MIIIVNFSYTAGTLKDLVKQHGFTMKHYVIYVMLATHAIEELHHYQLVHMDIKSIYFTYILFTSF